MHPEDIYKRLQQEMNKHGERLAEDGYLGPETLHALNKYDFDVKIKEPWYPDLPVSPEPAVRTLTPTSPDRTKFFEIVRRKFGPLSQSQVNGYNFILNAWAKEEQQNPHWIAYALATVKHECANTFEPVSEYGGEKYLKSKPYYPYYGRGYVQLTWKRNYEKYEIADHPEKALDPALAAYIMCDGMLNGIFTGKKLSDYFNAHTNDAFNARRIINGLDKANLIKSYYDLYLPAVETLMPGSVSQVRS